MADAATGRLIDGLFRTQAGRITARLARLLGPGRLDEAEEIVQTTLVRALQVWPRRGMPDNPSGWLWRVARNIAIDGLRQRRFTAAVTPEMLADQLADERVADTPHFAAEIADDTLALMFACCHPLLSPEARVALTLKNVAGLGVREIARAFLLPEPTLAQRLLRARGRLAEAGIRFAIPSGEELPERLGTVLATIYLLFNEGYGASGGEDLVRPDLAAEAVRLARILADHPLAGRPEAEAMAVLTCLAAARIPARTGPDGMSVPLAEQDRRLWDQRLIATGLRHLRASMAGPAETRWHLEAAIAAAHACTPCWEATDWRHILILYERLAAAHPAPVVLLNRAVVLAELKGPAAGLAALAPLADDPALARYPLFAATRAELYRRLGETEQAMEQLRAAIALAERTAVAMPDLALLRARLTALQKG